MLTVKASAKASKVHGIGLFADEKIPKGTIWWKFDPHFDLIFDPKEVEKMAPVQRDLIKRYGYRSMTMGKWVYSTDDSRFINHSSVHDNVEDVACAEGGSEGCSAAKRDIEIGEELLINYRTYDANDQNSDAEYLNN